MLRSMTGFGAGAAEDELRIVTVEARSVNHRYLDVRVHIANELMRLVPPIEALAKKLLSRGRVDIGVQVAPARGREMELEVDLARAEAYRSAYVRLADTLGMTPDVSLETIASMPGVLRTPDVNRTLDLAQVTPALEAALSGLSSMRAEEGRALDRELRAQLAEVRRKRARIESLIPGAAADRKSKLGKRLQDLLGDQQLDPIRLAQEVALLADRADVTEELQRLDSHAAQFESLLGSDEPIGRRLDFLLQEMNRETNTIGSKSSNTDVAYVVVDIKAELERMREQAQNVE